MGNSAQMPGCEQEKSEGRKKEEGGREETKVQFFLHRYCAGERKGLWDDSLYSIGIDKVPVPVDYMTTSSRGDC